jgi:hypothetical protein
VDSGTTDDRGGPAVDRVRADLARLAGDPESAPDIPRSVNQRVVSALRGAPPVRAARASAVQFGAAVGLVAALTAAGLGTVMLLHSGGSTPSTGSSAQHLPAEPPPVTVPLSTAEILELVSRRPDLGALDDARRRSSCLSGLGYPTDALLGGRQVEMNGAPAVVLVLPGDTAETVTALAVRPNCNSADTGLLADTQIRRP